MIVRLNSIEDIATLPKSAQSCTIERQDLLKFVFDNRNNEDCILNVDKLKDILMKSTDECYKKRKYIKEVVIKRNTIDQILK